MFARNPPPGSHLYSSTLLQLRLRLQASSSNCDNNPAEWLLLLEKLFYFVFDTSRNSAPAPVSSVRLAIVKIKVHHNNEIKHILVQLHLVKFYCYRSSTLTLNYRVFIQYHCILLILGELGINI